MLLMYATTPVCMLVKLPNPPIKAEANIDHSTPMEGKETETTKNPEVIIFGWFATIKSLTISKEVWCNGSKLFFKMYHFFMQR
jgi:hypothetical protein